MKDEEIKLEEIEVSHTQGGYRRCRSYSVVRFRYTRVNRSRRICCHKDKVLVVSDTFVYSGSINREVKTRLIYECRCDERLKAKAEGSTRLVYTL